MIVSLRIVLPNILITLIGAWVAWFTGRVVIACDAGIGVCPHGGSGFGTWLVFVNAVALFLYGGWRLAKLAPKARRRWRAMRRTRRSAPAHIGDETTARRLAAITARLSDLPAPDAAPTADAVPAPAPPAPIAQMDGTDPSGWLRAQPAMTRDYVASRWDWDHDLDLLHWLVSQPDCDGGIAAGVFWRALVVDKPDADAQLFAIARSVAQRFERGRLPVRYAFDDAQADELHAAAIEAFRAGEIDWNPAFLPVRSSGRELTIEDLPAGDRPAVLAFLRHISGGGATSCA